MVHEPHLSQPRRRFVAALGVLASVGFFVGCFDGFALEGLPCQEDADCGPFLFCVGEPGNMVCDEDPFAMPTTAPGESESSESESSTTDPETTGPDQDMAGECIEPVGMCEGATPPPSLPTEDLEGLIDLYCENYTGCGCVGYAGKDDCITEVTAAFDSEANLAGILGSELDSGCIGFRIAFMADMGCRPARGINPPLPTIQACDARNCSIWSGPAELGESCMDGATMGNPINSLCLAPAVCEGGVCIDPCVDGNMPPFWGEDPLNPEPTCAGPGELCSVCNTCVAGECVSPAGTNCGNDDDCGTASYCSSDSACAPRRKAGECCELNNQCLSLTCEAGACQPLPYVCEMPFPSEFFMFDTLP